MGEFFTGLVLGVLMGITWTCLVSTPDIYPTSWEYATEVCSGNGGIKLIEEGHIRYSKAVCTNGAIFKYDNSKVGAKHD